MSEVMDRPVAEASARRVNLDALRPHGLNLEPLRRTRLVLCIVKVPVDGAGRDLPSQQTIGDLTIAHGSQRAIWKGRRLRMTLSEFKVTVLLATNRHRDVAHREIYDAIRGPGFVAGAGPEGYRANVRTCLKRVREAFRLVDPEFDAIKTYSGFGYRWDADEPGTETA